MWHILIYLFLKCIWLGQWGEEKKLMSGKAFLKVYVEYVFPLIWAPENQFVPNMKHEKWRGKKVKANLHSIHTKKPLKHENQLENEPLECVTQFLESLNHKQIWKYSTEFKLEPVHSFIFLIRQHGPLCECEYRTGPWFKPSINLSSKVILIPICGAIPEPCGLMPYI